MGWGAAATTMTTMRGADASNTNKLKAVGLNKRNLEPRRKAKDYDNDDGAEDDDDKTPSAGRPKKSKRTREREKKAI